MLVATREAKSSEMNKMVQAKSETKPQGSQMSVPCCCCCGKAGCNPATCHFKEATCLFCGKVDHLKSVCNARKKIESQCKKKSLDLY